MLANTLASHGAHRRSTPVALLVRWPVSDESVAVCARCTLGARRAPMSRTAPPFQGPRYSRRRRPDSEQTATQLHALCCSLALLQLLRARGRGRHGQPVQCLHVRVPPATERLTSQMQSSLPHRSPHSPYQRPTSPCAGWPTCVRRLVCPKLAGLKCMWNVSDLVSGLQGKRKAVGRAWARRRARM
jgi:hypothetical protein